MTVNRTLFFLMVSFSVIIGLVTFRFLFLGVEIAFPVLQANFNASRLVFFIHIVAAPIALMTGVIQFNPHLRVRRPYLHRWTGRVYGMAVLLGGLSGLGLAYTAWDRPIAALGFGILAVIWLGITYRGIMLARQRQIVAHRRWMIRSFALTFGAVTLRLHLPVLFLFGLEYPEASNIVAWSA